MQAELQQKSANEAQLVAASRSELINEEQIQRIVCSVIGLEVEAAETRLQNAIGPLLDKLRASNSKLGKRLDQITGTNDSCQSGMRELERRLTQVELAQQRVGTPGAAEWLNTARKELDSLGQSLKNCPKVSGQPMAEQLLGDMKKAQLLVKQSSVFASSCAGSAYPSSILCDKLEDPFPIGNGSLGEQGDTDDELEAFKPQHVVDRGFVLDSGLNGLIEGEEEDTFNVKTSEAMASWSHNLVVVENKRGELEALEEETLLDIEGLLSR